MAQPQLGFDSYNAFSQSRFNAASKIGQPLFWGRYFHAPGRKNYAGKVDGGMYSKSEGPLLNRNGCRLLPLARQTPTVGGSADDGARYAARNVAAIFDAFPPSYLYGADPDVIVFLDVEPSTQMSAEYYGAWSKTLQDKALELSGGTVKFHPAVYLNSKGNGPTVTALNKALDGGSVCAGLWTARYPAGKCADIPPWPNDYAFPNVSTSVPVLAWQCREADANGCGGFDYSLINPDHADIFLSRLILPPASAGG
jgi:hypothetical protein